MMVQAIVTYEADTAHEALDRVEEWTLTPGASVTVMMGRVEPGPPSLSMRQLTESPVEVGPDGKVPELHADEIVEELDR